MDVLPAFVPLLPGKGGGRIAFHEGLPAESLNEAVLGLQHETVLSHSQLPGGAMGRTRLPGSLMGRIVKLGDFFGRICPLTEEMPYYGLLLSRRRSPETPLARKTAMLWAMLTGLLWGGVVLRRSITGRWPALPIRHGLTLWFLGLVCIPMTLGFKAGLTYIDDLRSNLTESCRRGLAQVLNEIEAGSSGLRGKHLLTCRNLVHHKGLVNALKEIQLEGKPDGPLLSEIEDHLRKGGIDVLAVFVIGQGNWIVKIFSKDLPENARTYFPILLGGFANQLLRELDQDGKIKAEVEKRLAELHARRPELKRLASLQGLGNLGIITSSENLRLHVDVIQSLQMGRRHNVLYFDLVPDSQNPWFLVGVFWNQELAYQQYLETAIPKAFLAYMRRTGQSIDLAAFQRRAQRLEMVRHPAGNVRGLKDWTLGGEGRTTFALRDGQIWLTLPCNRMPGFLLTARISLDPLTRLIAGERTLWEMVILCLAIMAALGGKWISHWLASPIIRMTRGLQRVSKGDLSARLGEERADELGQATATLDTMIAWLREREQLLPYVSSKVLDAVGGGNLFKAGAGSVQRVVVLVSDIRSFTTLAETYPPEEIFETLNEHIREMAVQIQEHGGSIDRFVGDALWAVFYKTKGFFPAAAAVRAAVAMMLRHAELTAERRSMGRFLYEIGVGLDEGDVIAGILGDPDSRLDFTVIGEVVNSAASCESASKKGTRTRIVGSSRVIGSLPSNAGWGPIPGEPGLFELQDLQSFPVSRVFREVHE